MWPFIPHVPFELVIGLWLLVKGCKRIEQNA